MKQKRKTPVDLFVLLVALTCMSVGQTSGQTLTALHYFIGSDGSQPYAGLLLSSNTLYGTTSGLDSSANGTVFAVSTDGTFFSVLYSFSVGSGSLGYITNSDGAFPMGGLVLSSNTLYGTAHTGGSAGNGTLFGVNTDGTGFTTLYDFTATSGNLGTNSDGAGPEAGLISSGNTLYGTTQFGGSAGGGTVFKVNTDGTGFTTLHSFNGFSDGLGPNGGLLLSSNTLYGTTSGGPSYHNGTVFKVNTDGTVFRTLYNFTLGSGFLVVSNTDGASPQDGLVLSGNTLYGTAYSGGSVGNGTVFAVNTDGTGFTNLHSFGATRGNLATNWDGANPEAGLILSGNTLYGTASKGGTSGAGTVFTIRLDGTGFTSVASFTHAAGAEPSAGLVLSDNTLYGTAVIGGVNNGAGGYGTVFSFSLPPELTIIPSRSNVILTWPTNADASTLQFTTDLVSPVWTTVSPQPGVFIGKYAATNPVTGPQQFYRLSQ